MFIIEFTQVLSQEQKQKQQEQQSNISALLHASELGRGVKTL